MRGRDDYARPNLQRNENLKEMTKVAGLISTLPQGPGCKNTIKRKCIRK